jgi:eukaryotic-like serine/threonine-protein kinase
MKTFGLYLSVVVLSALTAFGTTVFVLRSGRFTRTEQRVTVPNLVGISEKDARANLQALGFVFLVGARKPTADAQPDTVIAQSVAPGQALPHGQAITLTFAEALPKVPDVVGHTLDEARQLLAKQGIQVEEGKPVPSKDVAPGHVVSQDPPAGPAPKKPTQVVVSLSSGPSEVAVPKVLGQPVTKAEDTLKAAGLEAQVVWTELAETATGVVLSQRPAPDAKAKPGDKVMITVNHE